MAVGETEKSLNVLEALIPLIYPVHLIMIGRQVFPKLEYDDQLALYKAIRLSLAAHLFTEAAFVVSAGLVGLGQESWEAGLTVYAASRMIIATGVVVSENERFAGVKKQKGSSRRR